MADSPPDVDEDVEDLDNHNHNDENATDGVAGEEDPIDLKVRNVVAMFHTLTHIDLKIITASMCHVVYDRSKGVVEKRLRTPHACVKIWSSGKVILTACKSEEDSMVASRRIARILQKILGPKVKFASFRIVNIMATCRMPFGVRIDQMAREYPGIASYEPELNTGLIWKSGEPKGTVRIHTTGSIIVTGSTSSADILSILTTLYPKLTTYRCKQPSLEVPSNSTGDEPKRKRGRYD